ncbi:MAG: hypothetical protein WBB69_01265 [Anaerolineales bacterium]
MKERKKYLDSPGSIWLPVLFAAGLKIILLATGRIPFNADEAIVALMARHINQGNLPIFFYGQSYMGSMDAILVALGFKAFGEAVSVIRILQSLLYLGTVYTTAVLGKIIFKSPRAAVIAGMLAAVPPVNVSLYTTISLGGYGELLFIGNLLLISGIQITRKVKKEGFIAGTGFHLILLGWGMGAGFAFWVIGLSLVYTIPAGLFLMWEIWKSERPGKFLLAGFLILSGGLIGAMPWWIFALINNSTEVFSELAGSALSGISNGTALTQVLQRFGSLFLFGSTVLLGLRPPWGVRWLMMPILPFILVFWCLVFYSSIKNIARKKYRNELPLFGLMGVILLAGFILTPYGADPSGRYFVPLILPMVIFGTEFLIKHPKINPKISLGIVALILIFNLGGTIQSILEYPPGLTSQFDKIAQIDHQKMGELMVFLEKKQITRGYTNYWVSYPLAFLSNEQLIFVPRLPYHEDFRYTARDDRYPPYDKLVLASKEIGYITTKHPILDNYLRQEFKSRGISWEEKQIGDFQIFYELSVLIHPQELGLGTTTIQ